MSFIEELFVSGARPLNERRDEVLFLPVAFDFSLFHPRDGLSELHRIFFCLVTSWGPLSISTIAMTVLKLESISNLIRSNNLIKFCILKKKSFSQFCISLPWKVNQLQHSCKIFIKRIWRSVLKFSKIIEASAPIKINSLHLFDWGDSFFFWSVGIKTIFPTKLRMRESLINGFDGNVTHLMGVFISYRFILLLQILAAVLMMLCFMLLRMYACICRQRCLCVYMLCLLVCVMILVHESWYQRMQWHNSNSCINQAQLHAFLAVTFYYSLHMMKP